MFALYAKDPYYGYFSEATVTTLLNNALYQLQRRLLKTHASRYTVCTSTTLVVGQEQYQLPDDFLAMFDLWIDLDSGTPPETRPLEWIPASKRHEFVTQYGTPSSFYMLKNSVNLRLIPDTALTLEMLYAYKVPLLSSNSDVPDVPDSYHEYLVLLAVLNAYTIDDRVNELVNQRLEYFEKLLSANEERVLSKPRYIIEVN